MTLRRTVWTALAVVGLLRATPPQILVNQSLRGFPGGRLVCAQRTEPKTLNPVLAADAASREVIHRMTGDLVHINRLTQKTEPALAKSWTVSPDGLHYVLRLRQGISFSDGYAFGADDVVFSFQVYLDETVNSPQRSLLILDGKPIRVSKLDSFTVAFDLPRPYAAAERLFDGFAILPAHRLRRAWEQGRFAEVWGLTTPPAEIAGLGPFRLKRYVAGERIVLERNPYYWKADGNKTRLPYLNEVEFVFAGSEDLQTLRFQAGESDVISRVSAKNFAALQKEQARRGHDLRVTGPGLEYSFLFFNLNDLPAGAPREIVDRQAFFKRLEFRQAVSSAIDRDAIVRLVYSGHAQPLASPVPAGNRAWVNSALPKPVRSPDRARKLLAAAGFRWAPDGALQAPGGQRVEFSIVTSSGNAERMQMATIIQDDLSRLGMRVHVVPLDMRSLLDRVQGTKEYEACLLSLANGDADPNPDMNVWLSSGSLHLWNPERKSPATPWEAEIDGLMRRQMITLRTAERKRLFDRVQELLAANLPLIPLVSPEILTGAKKGLVNFRPAPMDHYVLWNVEELCWNPPLNGTGR